MPKDITLLPEELKEEKFQKVKEKLQRASIILLGITILVVASVFIFWAILRNQISQISVQIQNQEQIIADFRNVESLQKALKIKLSSLAKILSSEPSYGEILSDLRSLLPSGVSFLDLSVEQNGKISLSGVALNSQEFAGFINALTDKTRGGKFFTDVTLGSVTGAKDGSYKFSLTMVFKR